MGRIGAPMHAMRQRARGTPLLEALESRRLFTVFYFNVNGNDVTGNATKANPWATLAKADRLHLKPGDTLLLAGGQTFTGSLLLDAADAGTAADPVTIASYGVGTATIQNDTGVGISAVDCGGVTIENLNLVGPGRNTATADGIQFLNDLPAGSVLSSIDIDHVNSSGFLSGIEMDALPSDGVGKNEYQNVTITQCKLHNDADAGFITDGNYSLTSTLYSFINLKLEYDQAYSIYHSANSQDTEDGITLQDADNSIVTHCTAHDNGLSGDGEVGIWAWDSNDVTIENCTSYRNHTGGTDDGDGFDLDGGDTNCILQNNDSYDNDGTGYGLYQFHYARPYSGNIVRDNTSVDDGRKNGYGGIDIYNVAGSPGLGNCQVYGNTVQMSPATGETSPAFKVSTPINDIRVYDNSFSTTGGVPLVSIVEPQTQLTFQDNTYSSGGAAFEIIDNGTTYNSVSAWNQATGQEGMLIIPTFDSSITNDPQAATIEATINTAIRQYEENYSTPITLKIYFEEGPGLGGSDTPHVYESYKDYRAAFAAVATTADQKSALASLPLGKANPLNGSGDIDLTQANARVLGFKTHTGYDGVVTLTTSEMNLTRTQIDPNKYDLQDVAEHEIDEVLGIGSDLDGLNNGDPVPAGQAVTDEDLFRYTKGRGRSYTTASSANAYFSDDGGKTDLARFNQDAAGDFGDWFSVSGDQVPQVQDAFGTPGVYENLGVELTVLDVLGYERMG